MEVSTKYGLIYFEPKAVVEEHMLVYLEMLQDANLSLWKDSEYVIVKGHSSGAMMRVPKKFLEHDGDLFMLVGIHGSIHKGIAVIVSRKPYLMDPGEKVLHFLREVLHTRLYEKADDAVWQLAKLRKQLGKKSRKDHLYPLLAGGTTALAIAITQLIGWPIALIMPVITWELVYTARNMAMRNFKSELEILIDKWR